MIMAPNIHKEKQMIKAEKETIASNLQFLDLCRWFALLDHIGTQLAIRFFPPFAPNYAYVNLHFLLVKRCSAPVLPK
ncbi:hypothetical protein PGTUg99_014345 [Puccinia graminis f. sp. tritici]|uniref:Uncharacterized protein n=1 Tax=Puccinia graminis f. sp. tritici TaxID=56615 RepID=A0A5B0PW55_PUCGR|nr:hypothetical protein PGTUg99_014345 [Puccinia graminis f. sp. tritici]